MDSYANIRDNNLKKALTDFTAQHDRTMAKLEDINTELARQEEFFDSVQEQIDEANQVINRVKSQLASE